MGSKPLFSFCIPTRNRANLLARAIESCLAQTYENIDVIIVDNASQDNTEEVAKGYSSQNQRIRYLRNSQHVSQWQNIFKAFSLAEGHYAQYLADDNFVLQNYAEEKVRCFQDYPEVGLVGSALEKYQVKNGKLKLVNVPSKGSRSISSDSVFRNFHKDTGTFGLLCTFRSKDMQLAMNALKEIPNPYGYLFSTLNMCYDLLLFIYILARYPSMYFTDKTTYFDVMVPSEIPDPVLSNLVESHHLHKLAIHYTFFTCNLDQYVPFFRRYMGSSLFIEIVKRIILGPRNGFGLSLLPKYYADYHFADWIAMPIQVISIFFHRLSKWLKRKLCPPCPQAEAKIV